MFTPGDLVEFDFWSSYLAPAAYKNEANIITWHELFPGDVGMVICGDDKCRQGQDDDTVIVMFSRIEKVVRVHVNQLKHNTLYGINF